MITPGGPDLLTRLFPYGVVVAVTAVLLFATRRFLGEYLKKSGASAFERSSRWYSRRAKFGRRLASRYAEVVEQDFSRHAMGFVMDAVVDIDQGKSMLLKNSMLVWARQVRAGRAAKVPVFLELHRCTGSTDTLVDLIVAERARSRVDREGRPDRIRDLTLRGLRDGAFALLLDGLDEVGRDDRQRVFAALLDIAREYPGCQFIVTCRDVVYQGQPMGAGFAHVVRVAEFDDAAVIRFLGNWRGLADRAEVAELFTSLRNNPALMRVARSPLLLTMIAYLHTEVFTKSGRRLPTSRSAFYQEAITHLLGRDTDLGRAGSLAVYEVGEKLAVLQQVALRSMVSADRLTITRRDLEATTRELLPDLDLDAGLAKNVLDEIVTRSQIITATDKSRTAYTFRHLTLQEYLVAAELAGAPDDLLAHYAADPPAWRETVKLWCGTTTRDCTRVVAEIFGAADPARRVLALECLAEAQRVDHDFADRVIEHFAGSLGQGDPHREAIIAALGSVAADSRPRGRRVMALLSDLAAAGGRARVDAMLALSASGRVEAAHTLGGSGRGRRRASRVARNGGVGVARPDRPGHPGTALGGRRPRGGGHPRGGGRAGAGDLDQRLDRAPRGLATRRVDQGPAHRAATRPLHTARGSRAADDLGVAAVRRWAPRPPAGDLRSDRGPGARGPARSGGDQRGPAPGHPDRGRFVAPQPG
ncbi:NACHT domain-containing protein [Actinokineospora auranticolor]|uniref:NACHT domain-containing protein n=1 Tax=Actinokineospora auranticolor TaxID=155976 RepID=A0A2S6H0F2_9PSEU|nr:NACHT domain-containing protein [Actinokineospora auranticolor]PPK70959.1 NACHT domain-containing protein [Actinokineospora auranticolor]